jgi:multimeric flavodoxin WrbA
LVATIPAGVEVARSTRSAVIQNMNKKIKIITLICSQRKKGNSNEIADYLLTQINKSWDKEKVYLVDYSFKPCGMCMRCQRGLKCLINKEEDKRLFQKLDSADVLIFICPTINFNVPIQVKAWVDSMNYSFQNKAIGIIAIGNTGNTNVVNLFHLWFLPNNFSCGWLIISTDSAKKEDAYITGGLIEEFHNKEKIKKMVKDIENYIYGKRTERRK